AFAQEGQAGSARINRGHQGADAQVVLEDDLSGDQDAVDYITFSLDLHSSCQVCRNTIHENSGAAECHLGGTDHETGTVQVGHEAFKLGVLVFSRLEFILQFDAG